jgi:hypothetical protein
MDQNGLSRIGKSIGKLVDSLFDEEVGEEFQKKLNRSYDEAKVYSEKVKAWESHSLKWINELKGNSVDNKWIAKTEIRAFLVTNNQDWRYLNEKLTQLLLQLDLLQGTTNQEKKLRKQCVDYIQGTIKNLVNISEICL